MAVTWKKLAYEDDVITKALLTAKGDLVYASAASTPAALAIGTSGQALQVAASGIPEWVSGATPAAHAASHKSGGSDSIKLNEFAVPTAAVAFNGQQATNFIIHTVADATARDALTPVVGKAVFQSDTLAAYICTVAA